MSSENAATQDAAASGNPGDFPPALTLDELCQLLRMTRNTVAGLIQQGAIPGVRKIGAVYRVSRDAVLDWLRTGDASGGPR